ncbi:MAG: ferredoxin family protein [Chloroflexi bacterium]|nr:ferredoxin family protein [Chloroflexota bacterium]
MPDGMFIRVDIDDSVQQDAELARRLVEVCPVDIFARTEAGGVATVAANLDECTLCDLCIQAAGPERVQVVKLYAE